MSSIQQFFMRIFPRAWAEEMRAEPLAYNLSKNQSMMF
jgi:hypothetical protein